MRSILLLVTTRGTSRPNDRTAQPMSRTVKIVFASLIGVALVLTAFVGGLLTARIMSATISLNDVPDTGSYSAAVAEVWELLQAEALEPPTETTATIGLINGLVQSNGDRYARFIPESEMKEWAEQKTGTFGGIGVVLSEKDGTVYVVEVYDGTPAAKAGLRSGDYFYAVDGEENENWTVEGIQARVKGEIGTDVSLTMMRPWPKGERPDDVFALGDKYDVTITRATIEVPIVESEMKAGNVGWVSLTDFNDRSTSELSEAIQKLEADGATSLILDLRNNPGGLLEQAVGVTSLFVDEGTVVTVESRTSDDEVLTVTGQTVTDLPLVVLINENSASAAEIVAGALQDHDRATLVGATSFGKGSVQTQAPLESGGIVVFTIAHYLTPAGQAINGVGLTPDQLVEMETHDMQDEATDVQLKAAIEAARSLR